MPEFTTEWNDRTLSFETSDTLFSPHRPDAGTLALLSCVEFQENDRILDLGCGYGLVGVIAAQSCLPQNVFLTDIDPIAIQYAQKNIERNNVPEVSVQQSDGFKDFGEVGLTKVLSNPPYHTDFSVAKHFIRKGFNRLVVGGEMLFVTKRDTWYRKSLNSVFGGCRVRQVDGYFVFTAEKRSEQYAQRSKKKRR